MPLGRIGTDMLTEFYRGKRVLVTGHTGFKGTWLCRMLKLLNADVYGYSLDPPTDPNLYSLIDSDSYINSKIADIADYDELSDYYSKVKPDIVFHLAAQPIVRIGYEEPRLTYLSNVMGTVNVMECVRLFGAQSVVNVTTDKVYLNIEDYSHKYTEDERLDGFDPYSNSKSCSELVTNTYVRSFPNEMCPTSTARAGNVIGGGDFSVNRIIPDAVRAAVTEKELLLRNPNSIRPYQHVLEPLYAYLAIAMRQFENPSVAGNYNIGPEKEDCITTGALADIFCEKWGNGMSWKNVGNDGPHEANFLKLDNSKFKRTFSIAPLWNIDDAVDKVVEWTKIWHNGGDVKKCIDDQIREYMKGRGTIV